MADRIMMTPQELEDGAAFLRQRLDAIEQEVAQIKSKIDDVCSRWEGGAQQAFIQQFEGDMYPILKDNVPQVIDGVAQELDAAAQALRDTDDALKSAFSSN